jgi:hypothetical protein
MSERAHPNTARSGCRPGRRRTALGARSLPLAAAVVLALGATACEPTDSSATGPTTSTTDGSTSTTAVGVAPTTELDATGGGVTEPGDVDPPTPTRPTLPTESIVTGGTAVGHPNGGTREGSVHTVDLDDLNYPSSVCADVIDRPPRAGYDLEDGKARSAPDDPDPYVVTLRPARSFGDVNDDGHDDVAVVLECGHESQPVPIGWIYTVDGSGPRPLAQVVLDPDDLPLSDVLDTSLRTVRITGSKVVTDWSVYLDGDALCCPTKTATVSWTWTNGLLAPGAPIITRTDAGG